MNPVQIWHTSLCVVSLFNVCCWLYLFFCYYSQPHGGNVVTPWQLFLSLFYVLGCAFRSFFPRADLQRIAIVDSPLSAVFYGRSVATVAELAYAAQVGLYFDLLWLIVPVLLLAEILSWYAILSDRALFNMVENSLWTLCGVFVFLSRPHWIVCVVCLSFVGFEVSVDLPMYWKRHQLTKHNTPRSLSKGLWLLQHDLRITSQFEDWKEELAWMGGYFSLAVWSSLLMCI